MEKLTSHIKFTEEEVGWFYKNEQLILIDKKGNELSNAEYDAASDFFNGIATTKRGDTSCLITYKGIEFLKAKRR